MQPIQQVASAPATGGYNGLSGHTAAQGGQSAATDARAISHADNPIRVTRRARGSGAEAGLCTIPYMWHTQRHGQIGVGHHAMVQQKGSGRQDFVLAVLARPPDLFQACRAFRAYGHDTTMDRHTMHDR
ncbi:hypothetical protein RAA17_16180 [Komagataeibacter rhaeticus]|nr:hypothetical protein [Komagataeibacter rhaeticus]